MLFLLCTALVVSFVDSEPMKYTDCGSVEGKIASVDLSPCPTQPCYVKKGSNMSLVVNFTSEETAPRLEAKVYGIIGGVPIPFPLPNPDACKSSGLQCPIGPGQSYSYKAILPVLKSYPSIKVVVKWELSDYAQDVFCFVLPVEIGD